MVFENLSYKLIEKKISVKRNWFLRSLIVYATCKWSRRLKTEIWQNILVNDKDFFQNVTMVFDKAHLSNWNIVIVFACF